MDQSLAKPTENLYGGERVTLGGLFPAALSFLDNATGYVTGNGTLTPVSFELSTSVANASATTAVPETFSVSTTSNTQLATGS